MSDTSAPQNAQSEPTVSEPTTSEPTIESLVGAWLSIPEVAERLGMRLSDVRRLVEDRYLLTSRVGANKAAMVPELFLDEEGPLPALHGTFTVLADGGMDDDEILRWLFTPDETLPVAGHAVDAIRAGFKTEVRRRAMESAF
ncbi:Rv2175c family DNA-binding protein [Kribbia dieselivorans]|uniref:Rv2175c family DNA-binding protein n=1 Tax=Kribbia dieselivorans TaxID=331526 RepID=UPI001FE1F517|nr:Rv2175c family DNA-binding protein [Kribbia dieselivorans]